MRGWRFVIASVCLVCAGCNEQGGQSAWIEHEDTTRSYTETYVSADGIHYDLSSKRWDMHFVSTYSDGDVMRESKMDTARPDKAAGEYDRIRLAKRGDTVVLTIEFKYDYDEGGGIESSSQGDLELVSGTWADFAAGKEVTVRFTEASHALRTQDLRRQAAEEYEANMRDVLIEELSYENIGPERLTFETSVELFETDNEPFTLSRNAIRWGHDKPLVIKYRTSYSID